MIKVKNRKIKVLSAFFVLIIAGILIIAVTHSKSTVSNCCDIIINDGILYLPNGDAVSLEGSVMLEDSRVRLADGRIVSQDGSITNTDGSISMKNGSVYKDGCLLLDNGIRVERDGRVIMPDGSLKEDMKVIVHDDNTVTVNDEYDLAIDDFTIVLWDMEENKELIERNMNAPIVYSNDVVNILVAGLDKEHDPNKKDSSCADSVILLSIDKGGKKVNIISLSRATLVGIPGHGKHRLNSSYQYGGADLLVDTIEKNFKIKIDYYVLFNFEYFIKLIDILGGIKVKLTEKEIGYFKNYLKRTGQKISEDAEYIFDGKETLLYVRLREIDSDRARTSRQRRVIYQLMEKANSLTPGQIFSLYSNVYKKINTNMTPLSILRRFTLLCSAIHWENSGEAIPRQPSQLTRNDDGFDVLMIYWPLEVNYLKSILYKNTTIKVWKE